MKTILLADDEQLVLEVLSDILRHHGYQVLTAPTAEKALTLIDLVDIVVTDYNFGLGMNGSGLLSIIRTKHRNLPVVLLTASINIDTIPFTAVLSKPIKVQELLEVIKQLLNHD